MLPIHRTAKLAEEPEAGVEMGCYTRLGRWVALAALAAATVAEAQTPEPKALWRQMVEADLQAAYRLIQDNHPATVPALKDDEFRHRLADAYILARERAIKVQSYGGYAGVMTGLAGALGDDHIAFRPLLTPARVRWAGYMVTLRGQTYVVTEVDAKETAGVAAGDVLTACDGRPAAVVAEQRLAGFRGDWSSRARRSLIAPYLLIDTDNPFAPAPAKCVFDHQGRAVEASLAWRDIANADANARARRASPIGQAGMGVRAFDDGYWIGLQRLDPDAAKVIAAVKAQREALEKAKLVVIDLRGDGGGNSMWGDQLAGALWGPERLQAAQRLRNTSHDLRCAISFWRASPDNLKTLQLYASSPERFGPSGVFTALARQMSGAIAEGRPFGGDYSVCLDATSGPPSAPPALPPSPLQGKVLVLTDASCFSSCLIALDLFRSLGAVHIGQPTSAWSHYTEVREAPLPSGLGTFSTLQAVDLAAPPRTGPFLPATPYDGDIADTVALEHWVTATF